MKKQLNRLTECEFEILLSLRKNGDSQNLPLKSIAKKTSVSFKDAVSSLKNLVERKLIGDDYRITRAGLAALSAYKVNNAIIMAAGVSSRFVPLSYDLPKALLKVKGEVLIERQIRQLKEAGISDIIVVVGYKKEMLFYLEEKYGVKIIVNPSFLEKNNIETIRLASVYIGNSYICCSDQYFDENPFSDYVYDSYYNCDYSSAKKKASYVSRDKNGFITDVKRKYGKGAYLYGEAYWDKEFAKAFLKLIQKHYEIGDYDSKYWESLYYDNITELPPLKAKLNVGNAHEFDSLDELREFDLDYIDGVDSKILDNISAYFHCEQGDIKDFRTIKKGLTNTSFSFSIGDNRYVYRHPGAGANDIINRRHEQKCLEIAKENAIDPTFIVEEPSEGWKISKFVYDFHEPDYRNPDDCRKVIETLRKLHSLDATVDWVFDPWQESILLEEKIKERSEINMQGFGELKSNIERLLSLVDRGGSDYVFCHCDTYSSNWMITKDNVYLIDWEYGGMANQGIDVGYYMADGEFTVDEAKSFIKEYLQDKFTEEEFFRYLAWASITSYYWFVWALYKESRGAIMGESLYRWYKMAKKYSDFCLDNWQDANLSND